MFLVLRLRLSNVSTTYERAGGPQEMNHSGAREISEVSSAVEPASRVPGPVRDGRVDTARDDEGVHEVGQELTPLSYRPGDNRGRGGSEHKLIKSNNKNTLGLVSIMSGLDTTWKNHFGYES